MDRSFRSRVVLVAAAVLLTLAACGREQAAAPTTAPTAPAAPAPAAPAPFRVGSIDLGPAIDGTLRVSAPTAVFKPSETIYASVVTEGASPSVVLVAKWTFEDGQVVSQDSKTIAPTGPAATEFHISKPSGWPEGKYQVEVVANGASVGVRDFVVQE